MDHLASSINLVIDALIVIHLIEHLDCCLSLVKLIQYIAPYRNQPASFLRVRNFGKRRARARTHIHTYTFCCLAIWNSMSQIFGSNFKSQRCSGNFVAFAFFFFFFCCDFFGEKRGKLRKNDGVMILASAPFLPARAL